MKKNIFIYQLLFLFFNKTTPDGFTPLGFLVRVFLYSGILITLVLPSIDKFGGQSFAARSKENSQTYLNALHRSQTNYQFEMGRFADSVHQLETPLNEEFYTFRIISPMIPVAEADESTNVSQSIQSVVTIAQPQPEYSRFFKSYIGVIFFENNQGTIREGICEMNKTKTLPTMLPTLNNDQTIQCPPGSTLLK